MSPHVFWQMSIKSLSSLSCLNWQTEKTVIVRLSESSVNTRHEPESSGLSFTAHMTVCQRGFSLALGCFSTYCSHDVPLCFALENKRTRMVESFISKTRHFLSIIDMLVLLSMGKTSQIRSQVRLYVRCLNCTSALTLCVPVSFTVWAWWPWAAGLPESAAQYLVRGGAGSTRVLHARGHPVMAAITQDYCTVNHAWAGLANVPCYGGELDDVTMSPIYLQRWGEGVWPLWGH